MEGASLKGKVYKVFEEERKSEKFRKREFVVEVNSTNSWGTHIDYIKFQAVQSNCDLLNGVSKGDLIVVKWSLMGRKWKKDGKESFFTNVEAKDITVVSKGTTNAADDAIEEQFPMGPEDNMAPAASQAPPPPDDGPDDLPF